MRAVAVKVQQSMSVHADLDLVWELLLDPAIWSLRSAVFMFAVPDSPVLRLWVGSTALGLPNNGLYEVDENESAGSVTFRQPAPSRHSTRLSVRQARRGVAKVHVEIVRHPSRLHANSVELATYAGADRWLRGIRDVAEGRKERPGNAISAAVQRLCVQVPRQAADWISVTEGAVIDADPAAVWALVQEPHHHPDSLQVPVASGRVPGTRAGVPGEIQYFVARSAEGMLTSAAVVVSGCPADMDVLSHLLRPPYYRTRYRVSPDAGGARLEITWTGPPGPGGAARDFMAEYLRHAVSCHMTAAEGAAGPAGQASGD